MALVAQSIEHIVPYAGPCATRYPSVNEVPGATVSGDRGASMTGYGPSG